MKNSNINIHEMSVILGIDGQMLHCIADILEERQQIAVEREAQQPGEDIPEYFINEGACYKLLEHLTSSFQEIMKEFLSNPSRYR